MQYFVIYFQKHWIAFRERMLQFLNIYHVVFENQDSFLLFKQWFIELFFHPKWKQHSANLNWKIMKLSSIRFKLIFLIKKIWIFYKVNLLTFTFFIFNKSFIDTNDIHPPTSVIGMSHVSRIEMTTTRAWRPNPRNGGWHRLRDLTHGIQFQVTSGCWSAGVWPDLRM